MSDLSAQKKQLRALIRARLERLSAAEIRRKSGLIHNRLFASAWWREARWLFVYIAFAGEVETAPIVARAYREGKQVAIPRMDGDDIAFYRYEGRTRDLLPNQFGILEPDPQWLLVDPLALEAGPLLVLAPGLGFDRSLRRLGRGKGCYDRFLARLCEGEIAHWIIGLAFAEQLVEQVPAGPHDRCLDGLITDREMIPDSA